MAKKDVFSRTLAISGTCLVWIPLLLPLIFSAASFIGDGIFRLDYLIPAELFPVALAGGGLVLWAALRAGARRGLIGAGLGVAIGALVGGQALAVITGLASGTAEPSTWLMGLVLGSLGVYLLALVEIGVGGILLAREL
jgi:hypothetical protein